MKMSSIIIVADDSGRLTQFRFPGFLPVILAIAFFLFSAVFFLLISDYRAVRSQISGLDRLEMENKLKKKQMVLLAQRVDRIGQKMKGLKEFDLKLKGLVSTEPEDEDSQFRGVGGTDFPFKSNKDYLDKGRIALRPPHRKLMYSDRASESTVGENQNLHMFIEKLKVGSEHIPSIWPVKGWVVERFGMNQAFLNKGIDFKSGIRISTKIGTPIVATAGGLVSNIDWHSSLGWGITLNHGNGVVTRYSNLQKILVGKGSYVTKGETIALAGSSAISKAPDLCYEILLNRVPVNPVCYLPN